MLIVGLTGGIGHGKTTFAELLSRLPGKSEEWESSTLIINVANAWRRMQPAVPKNQDLAAINAWLAPLPAVLDQEVHCVTTMAAIELTKARLKAAPDMYVKLLEYLALVQNDPTSQTETIDVQNKSFHRPLLQWLGGYLAKQVNTGIWFDEIMRQIQAADGLDLAIVGGIRFPADAKHVKDAGGTVVAIYRKVAGTVDSGDVTERERSAIVSDVIVLNDGTIMQLERCAAVFLADLQSGKLQPEYRASAY